MPPGLKPPSVEAPLSREGASEVEPQPYIAILDEYLIPPNLPDSAVEGYGNHRRIALGLNPYISLNFLQ